MRTAKKPPGGRSPIGPFDQIVVYDGQRVQLAVAESVPGMVVQRQLAVAPFHGGTAALEEVGAFRGDLFHPSALRLAQQGQWAVGLAQGPQQFLGKPPEALALFRLRASARHPVQVDRGDQAALHEHFHLRRQVQRLHLGLAGGDEKLQGQQHGLGQPLGLVQ